MEQIPQKQIEDRVKAENPWWRDPGTAFRFTSGMTPRPYIELFMPLLEDSTVRRAIVLMGPRRVGKTVLIDHAIQRLIERGVNPRQIFYISIDNPLYNGLGLEQMLSIYRTATGVDLAQDECFLFFDEIQYLREWEVHLKSLVDSYPIARIVASGSSAAALRLKSTESGAGRFTDFLLPPLTFHEYLTLLEQDHLVGLEDDQIGEGVRAITVNIDTLNKHFVAYLNFGGYPEVALSPSIQKDPERFVKRDIIDKVLLRDLPSLYGITDVQELNSLFTTLAFNTANEISLDQLAQGSGVSKTTIKRYIEYLEAAFLVKVVHRVDRTAKRFKRANFFKVYLTNPSMRAALFGPVTARDQAMGALVETAIFSQWFHSDEDLHYARWQKGEVDIVNVGPDQKVIWAVEVKWSDRYYERPNELKSLLKFCHAHNLSRAITTTKTQQAVKMKDSVALEFIPAALYCYLLGYNIVRQKDTGLP